MVRLEAAETMLEVLLRDGDGDGERPCDLMMVA